MRMLLTIALLVVSAGTMFGACGLKNDNTLYLPPQYPTLFSPPALHGSYVDPITGCTSTRLTNGATENSGYGMHIIYSNSAWMSDDDQFILVAYEPSDNMGIIDISGNIIVPLGNMPGYAPATSFVKWAGPSGSGKALSGHDLYYIQSSGGNSTLYRGSFSTSCAPTCHLDTPQTLHVFTGQKMLTWVGGEADVSADGDHALLEGCSAAWVGGVCKAKETIFYYQISTDTILGSVNISGHAIDGAQILPDNRVVFNWSAGGTHCTRAECYKGSSLYSSSLVWQHQIFFRNNHFVTGSDGVHQYTLNEDANIGACPGPNGFTKIDVDSLVITCIQANTGTNGAHWEDTEVSASKYGPWGLTINYDANTRPNSDSYPMGDYASLWNPHYNELVLVDIATGDDYNIIQHRSCAFKSTGVDYWKLPFASLSRDGRYIIYDTDFCLNSAGGYSDVMIIDVSSITGGQ